MSASRLIIFLHGIGASGQQLAPLASAWSSRLPHTAFAIPDAPYRNGYGGHQWFNVDGLQLDPGRVREARESFDRKIRDVITDEGFTDRLHDLAFVGVSQGAIMALDGVASGGWDIGGLIAFSGLLPPTPVLPPNNPTPVLLVHGADEHYTVCRFHVAAGQLRAAGFLVELEIEPRRAGHTISMTVAKTAVCFLQKVLS